MVWEHKAKQRRVCRPFQKKTFLSVMFLNNGNPHIEDSSTQHQEHHLTENHLSSSGLWTIKPHHRVNMLSYINDLCCFVAVYLFCPLHCAFMLTLLLLMISAACCLSSFIYLSIFHLYFIIFSQ